METTFEKLPAVDGSVACLTCGCGARSDLGMGGHIAVGFGSAGGELTVPAEQQT